MTGSVQNNTDINANSHMKNSKPHVGIINAPNGHYKPVLFSHVEATKQFNALDRDLYQQIKKIDKPQKKTPKSVFVLGGIGALCIAFPFLRKLVKK